MTRRWFPLLCCLSILFCAAIFSSAASGAGLQVIEAATRIELSQSETLLHLPLTNSTSQSLLAQVQVEVVDTQGHIRASVAHEVEVGPQLTTAKIRLPSFLTGISESEKHRLPWYRLRYHVKPVKASASINPAKGVISLSEITPNLFELNVTSPYGTSVGSLYKVRVRAAHPMTRRPVKGVTISAEIVLEDNEQGYTRHGLSDALGYVTFDFPLPSSLSSDDGHLKITGRLGELTAEAEGTFQIDQRALISITTDKPLYQPGQMLHMRALIFDSNKRPIAGHAAHVKISDPEETVLFRAPLKTSRFGVASADWQIPQNTRLGSYTIKVEMGEGRFKDSDAEHTVKISRYELPSFSVDVRPDRPYYLPGQNAEVEVRADCLFGKPVTKGHVRVVRETERRWNYREQKWEAEESKSYAGEVDGSGRFLAKVDLSSDHEELSAKDYARYLNLTFAAYLTDQTTGRTEQRRFDLRLTKEPIHLYISEHNYQANGLPLVFYISAFEADGTPAQCEVAINAHSPSPIKEGGSESAMTPSPLPVMKTNRYGVAKVSNLVLPFNQLVTDERIMFGFTAHCAEGKTGHHTQSFWVTDEPATRVETDKALYRPGEPIRTSIIVSDREVSSVFLDVTRGARLIRSEVVPLSQGRADIEIPYTREMAGEVTISAYSGGEYTPKSVPYGARTVIYPHDQELKIDIVTDQESYRPGGEVSAKISVRAPGGRGVESALGVVVFDKAVEERARTDQEFSGRFGFYSSWRGDHERLSGVTRQELVRLDMQKPLPDGLDLVAEMLLRSDYGYGPRFFGGEDYEKDVESVYAKLISNQLQPMKQALDEHYSHTGEYPQAGEQLRHMLSSKGVDLDKLGDPWAVPFRVVFSVEGDQDVLKVMSNGPDKRAETTDDFSALSIQRPYFLALGQKINQVVEMYHARTGGFIRDAATLEHELDQVNISLKELQDPWGQPYRVEFGVRETDYFIDFKSSGPDQRFSPARDYSGDDLTVWISLIGYFNETRSRIDAALDQHFKASGSFPQNEAGLRAALVGTGIDLQHLRDPWGRAFYTSFESLARYGDHVKIESRAQFGETARERTIITPVTQWVHYIRFRSVGEDGREGSPDDFGVGTFSLLMSEQKKNDESPQRAEITAVLKGVTGAISGVITDLGGAAIPTTKIRAINKATNTIYETTSDDEGRYLLRNLPAGRYDVQCEAPGFKLTTIFDVPVNSSIVTELNALLEVGPIAEMVTTTAERNMTLQTVTAMSVSDVPKPLGTLSIPHQMSTPRLREYFPETLLWQPSIETDQQGRAQVNFKLADQITTWKIAAVGSTVGGEMAVIEREIRAFQPFFVEHAPPTVLTEGDEISLPVVVRNYLERAQAVELEINPEEWFSLLGPGRKSAAVAAGEAAQEIFPFRAIALTGGGKQRVTARGADDANDAIEKVVTVLPHGQEQTHTTAGIFNSSATLEAHIPEDAIRKTARVEMKVYPNLLAHVMESVEGIMRRPTGCGEQTISAAYPSLLVLRYYHGQSDAAGGLKEKAQRYVKTGYEQLLGYRAENGGFSYWGRGEADLALTAYALKFFHDARSFIEVDPEVERAARGWILRQQRADGSWPAYYYGHEKEDARRTALLTAYMTRVLAETGAIEQAESKAGSSPVVEVQGKDQKRRSQVIKRALTYLSQHADAIDEPYLIASYALAALDAGEQAGAARAIERLRRLSHEEAETSYWALQTNTPFYGWGLAGRIETTALAVTALARASKIDVRMEQPATPQHDIEANRPIQESPKSRDELVNRGLLFLLRRKDQFGVWYSTQATINVLNALITLLDREGSEKDRHLKVQHGPRDMPGEGAEILVNGKFAAKVSLPQDHQLTGPVIINLSQFIAPGTNHFELRRLPGATSTVAQVVSSYYVPWPKSRKPDDQGGGQHVAQPLRMKVSYSQVTPQVGQEVTCQVVAERMGFQGYGMMLAEVGIPPGAEVDRASLESAVKESDWSLSRYDVLPDKVVIYLWPKARGTHFQFKFRTRFGMKAWSAASVLYDYYNPEARAVVAPTRFVVE